MNHVVAFTTELRTWLVFHNEHYVRYNQQSINSVSSTTLELVLGRNTNVKITLTLFSLEDFSDIKVDHISAFDSNSAPNVAFHQYSASAENALK